MTDSDPNQQKKQTLHEQRINKFIQKPISIDNENFDPELKQTFNQRNTFRSQIKYFRTMGLQFMASRYYKERYTQWTRFYRESFPMLIFVTFSTYMIWKMESQYDNMKQKIQNIKTLHQIEVEKEDEYIRQVLNGQKINLDVQIKDPTQKTQKYKFEDDEEEDSSSFDTKGDFYQGLQKDLDKGLDIPSEFKSDLDRYQKQQQGRNARKN